MWQLSHPFFTILHCFPWRCNSWGAGIPRAGHGSCVENRGRSWKHGQIWIESKGTWSTEVENFPAFILVDDKGAMLSMLLCLASAHLASPFLISVSDREGNDFFANWNMWSFFRLGSNTGFTWHFCSSSSIFVLFSSQDWDAKCEFNMSTFTAGGGCQVWMVTSFCAKAPRCIKYCCIWLLEAIMPPNC